ncbi:MAG: hypothetical protein H8D67_26170 [Deltaproteobacteria bacterium]|nr:hypothetical protein [Deltaproteobacteria bacterium]
MAKIICEPKRWWVEGREEWKAHSDLILEEGEELVVTVGGRIIEELGVPYAKEKHKVHIALSFEIFVGGEI